MNLLTIITPCSRFENLQQMENSVLAIPETHRRWIVVFDSNTIPSDIYLPVEADIHAIHDENGGYGNPQRNYALFLVKEGHIAFLDDDTILHPDLWENIKDLEQDFISYNQQHKDGSMRVRWNSSNPGYSDSGNFIISYECMGDIRWESGIYAADSLFAAECYKHAKSKIYLPKILSIYNSLR